MRQRAKCLGWKTFNNLEARSEGGYTKNAILLIAQDMKEVFEQIRKSFSNCLNTQTRKEVGTCLFTSSDFYDAGTVNTRLIRPRGPITTEVRKQNRDKSILEILLVDRSAHIIGTPQITLQIGLNKIRELLQKIEKTNRKTQDFLRKILPDQPTAVSLNAIQSLQQPTFFTAGDEDNSNDISRDHFFSAIKLFLTSLNQDEKNLEGFTLLFAHYFNELFDRKGGVGLEIRPNVPTHGGLKAFLTIMSRTPFSEIFQKCLSTQEQRKFMEFTYQKRDLMNKIKLRQYAYETASGTYEWVHNTNPLTLFDWTSSMEKEKDILSPPPGTEQDDIPDAMGALSIKDHNKRPILELRFLGEQNLDRTLELVREYADWVLGEKE